MATIDGRSHDEITVQVGPPWAPLPRYVWDGTVPPVAAWPALRVASTARVPEAGPLPFDTGRPIVLAKGATIGERGAPSARTQRPSSRPRRIAAALLALGAVVAPLEWFFFARRRRARSDATRDDAAERERLETVWAAGALLFAVGAGIVFYHIPIGSAGFFEYAGRSILEGKILYRDLWDNKLPSVYYLNALWQLLFGSRYVLHWLAQLGVLLTTLILFATFARGERVRHWGAATLAVSVLLSLPPLQHFGYTEPYALPFIMAALVAAQRRADVASGVFLCAAATFWIPSTLSAIAILVYLRERVAGVRFLLAFALSMVLYGALIVWAFSPPVIAALLHDMRSYEGMKSHLDAATLAAVVQHLLATLEATALIVPLAIMAGVVRRPQTPTQRFALVWLICTLAGAAINLNFFQHYFIPSVLPLVFAIAVYAEDWSRCSPVRRIVLSAIVVGLVLRAPQIAAGMRAGITGERDEVRATVAVGRVLDIAVPKGGRILVDGTADGIYLSANRDAAGRFANTFGLTLTSPELQRERRRQYLDDVRRADAVVVNADTAVPFRELDALLRAQFTPVCPGRIPGAEIHLSRRLGNVRQPSCPP
jgi:hypothetical protein